MSHPLDKVRAVIDGLDEHLRPEAAQIAVEALNDEQARLHRQWAALEDPKRREAEAVARAARMEAEAEVRAEIMAQIAEVAPEMVKAPEASDEPRPWADWHPLKPETHFFYGDECVIDGRVFISRRDPSGRQPNVSSPLDPGAAGLWEEKLPEPAPEAAADAAPGEDTPASTRAY